MSNVQPPQGPEGPVGEPIKSLDGWDVLRQAINQHAPRLLNEARGALLAGWDNLGRNQEHPRP